MNLVSSIRFNYWKHAWIKFSVAGDSCVLLLTVLWDVCYDDQRKEASCQRCQCCQQHHNNRYLSTSWSEPSTHNTIHRLGVNQSALVVWILSISQICTMTNPHLFLNHSDLSFQHESCWNFVSISYYLYSSWNEHCQKQTQIKTEDYVKPVTCHSCIAFLFRKYTIVAATEYWRLPSK